MAIPHDNLQKQKKELIERERENASPLDKNERY